MRNKDEIIKYLNALDKIIANENIYYGGFSPKSYNDLNEKLKTFNNFYVYNMADSMTLIANENLNPVLTLYSRCKVE